MLKIIIFVIMHFKRKYVDSCFNLTMGVFLVNKCSSLKNSFWTRSRLIKEANTIISSYHKCLLLQQKTVLRNYFQLEKFHWNADKKYCKTMYLQKCKKKCNINKKLYQIILPWAANQKYLIYTHFEAAIRHLCNFKSVDINTAGHATQLVVSKW